MAELKNLTEAVFVIDMNNGFCHEGLLADPTIKGIVNNIISLIEEEKYLKGQGLFLVNDAHTKTSVELLRYPEHCLSGSEESKTIKELAIYEQDADQIFYKNSTCALFAPGVMETLNKMVNLKRVYITGCLTDICIKNFAISLRCYFDEYDRDIDIVIVTNTVENLKENREEVKENTFKELEASGIKLVRKKERF